MKKRDLDILYYIFNYYEINGCRQNGKIFMSIIDDYSKKMNQKINFNGFDDLEDYEIDLEKGYSFIHELIFDEEEKDFIFNLLKSKNYYMKTFIKDLMKELGNESEKCEVEKIIDKYKRLPMINDIKFNGIDKYTIETTYGDFSFYLADKVLNDDEIIKYMKEKDRRKSCHSNATTLLNSYDDLYTIVSLCRNYFVGYYYHSYEYRRDDDTVIDLCSNMFIQKDPFDDLYDTHEILFMRNDELRKLYFEKIRNIKSNLDDESVLKCAMYSHSLLLNDNPEEKKRILEFNGITNLH